MDRAPIASGLRLGAALAGLAACAAVPGTPCPAGTQLGRRIYSGGGEAEWCRRPDGAREGPETRYYEGGAELVTGEHRDGAQHGVWRYRLNDGRHWRAERWEEGELAAATVDPAVGRLPAAERERLGPMTSGIIKLAARDPRTAAPAERTFVRRHPNGRPRVAGGYDSDGLRSGSWRWWYEDGRPAREIEFRGGLRDGAARAWHPNGRPAADGGYRAGERTGRWRFWDPEGRLLRTDVMLPDR